MSLIKRTKAQYSKLKAIKLNSPLVTRILVGCIILLFISFFVKVGLIIALLMAAVFNSLLQTFQLKRGLPTDFELSTFTTVLITSVFGLKWGIVNAILSKLIASVYTGNVVADHFFMIITYVNAAILTSIFGTSNLILIGLIIVSVNCILMFLISKNMLGIDVIANLSYTGTNFVFNSIVFLAFGNFVLSILRLSNF